MYERLRPDYVPSGVQINRAKERAQVHALLAKHGDITLSQLLALLPAPSGHLCPKCNGRGVESATYDAYPPGFPDSGWASDIRTYNVKCTVCDGEGYTSKLLVPKMIQQGWEAAD